MSEFSLFLKHDCDMICKITDHRSVCEKIKIKSYNIQLFEVMNNGAGIYNTFYKHLKWSK